MVHLQIFLLFLRERGGGRWGRDENILTFFWASQVKNNAWEHNGIFRKYEIKGTKRLCVRTECYFEGKILFRENEKVMRGNKMHLMEKN